MTSDTSAVAALPPSAAEHINAVNACDTDLIVSTCSASPCTTPPRRPVRAVFALRDIAGRGQGAQ
jgi:hypothetical protein